MKKRLSNTIIIIFSIIILYLTIKEKLLIKSSIYTSINSWYLYILPSLLPTFIISDILLNYNIIDYIPNKIKLLCQRLLSPNSLSILLLSFLSGSPSNSRNIRTMYDNKELSTKECNHLLLFTHYNNPVFILTTISLLYNKNISIILLITQYLSNIIIIFIFKKDYIIKQYTKSSNNNLSIILINSIKRSIDTILLICGITTIFSILSNLIISIFNLNTFNSIYIKFLFEITNGVSSLPSLNLSNIHNLLILTTFLSFGGISIHIQVQSQLINTPINYKYFLLGRLYQVIISLLISYLLTYIIPI